MKKNLFIVALSSACEDRNTDEAENLSYRSPRLTCYTCLLDCYVGVNQFSESEVARVHLSCIFNNGNKEQMKLVR